MCTSETLLLINQTARYQEQKGSLIHTAPFFLKEINVLIPYGKRQKTRACLLIIIIISLVVLNNSIQGATMENVFQSVLLSTSAKRMLQIEGRVK